MIIDNYLNDIHGVIAYMDAGFTHDGKKIAVSCLGVTSFIPVSRLKYAIKVAQDTLDYYESLGLTEDDVMVLSKQMEDEESEYWDLGGCNYRVEYKTRRKKKNGKNGEIEPKVKNGKKTKIYIIRDKISHALKVGKSKNPEDRLKSLQTSTPSRLSIINTFDGWDVDEKIIHNKLKALGVHISGEWFKDCDEVLCAIYEHFKNS